MFPLAIAKARLFTVEVNRLSKWKVRCIDSSCNLPVGVRSERIFYSAILPR